MIFTSTEAEQWAVEHLYPEVGIEPAAVIWKNFIGQKN